MAMVGPETLDWWTGRLDGRRHNEPDCEIVAILGLSGSGCNAAHVVGSDGRTYWAKFANNRNGIQELVNETVVSSVARIIGAPMISQTRLMPRSDLVGERYAEGYQIPPGLAHGSHELIQVTDPPADLLWPRHDGNSHRQAAILGMWDWCLGDDAQWLYDEASDKQIWSFDHNFWIGGGTGWTSADLASFVDLPWPYEGNVPVGIEAGHIYEVADRIAKVTAESLIDALADVPPAWERRDSEIEALGWMLFRRRLGAADRLRATATRRSKGGRRP